MTTKTEIFKKAPGVLSFQRGYVISDALFYNDGPQGLSPLNVVRHGIRGTQNINKGRSGESKNATSANAPREEVSNIQTTDSAKLDHNADSLVVKFDFRFLPIDKCLFACAPGKPDSLEDLNSFKKSLFDFIQRSKNGKSIEEISNRYARNIANARWLWRNRLIATSIDVKVNCGSKTFNFSGLTIPLHNFDNFSKEELELGKIIAEDIRGEINESMNVEAKVQFGVKGAIEVFPSQNYLHDKPNGFSRSLYNLGIGENVEKLPEIKKLGQAAIRDQKISNAIRTIDTWYPSFKVFKKVIPIEPNGANLDEQSFFRNAKGASAFDLIKKLNVIDQNSDDEKFMLACLLRGGVYSDSSK